MPTIWLGRGISNNIPLINALKDCSFSVVISHVSDEWAGNQHAKSFKEPDLHGIEYVNWTVETLKKYNFDFFIPGRCLGDFSYFPRDLSEKLILGCSLEKINDVDDKFIFYKKCKEAGFDFVAEVEKFNDEKSFINAYALLTNIYDQNLCFKPSKGIFGQGFRIIEENFNLLKSIQFGNSRTIKKQDLISAFKFDPEYKMQDMVLMPLFNGKEISVDGSFDGENYRFVGRTKNGYAGQVIITDDDIYQKSLKVAKLFNLRGIFNIQFMYHDEEAMILEVNPRPAGGIGISFFSDVDIINSQLFKIPDFSLNNNLKPSFSVEVMVETKYNKKINKINYS